MRAQGLHAKKNLSGDGVSQEMLRLGLHERATMTATEEPRNIPELREVLQRMTAHPNPWVAAAVREYLSEPYHNTGLHRSPAGILCEAPADRARRGAGARHPPRPVRTASAPRHIAGDRRAAGAGCARGLALLALARGRLRLLGFVLRAPSLRSRMCPGRLPNSMPKGAKS